MPFPFGYIANLPRCAASVAEYTFGIPNTTGNWTWEIYVRCLDATPLTQTGLTGWVLRADSINNW